MKTQNILKTAIGILEVLAVVLAKIEVNVNTKSTDTENDSGDNFSKAGGKSFSINFKFK